jgi:SWI/SNF-related matrix-associated actin-dependent regulator of chromatin subfamily A member 5
MYAPRSEHYIDLKENYGADDEEDELQIVQPPQLPQPHKSQQDEAVIEYARPSRAGLRVRKPNMSLKATENAFNGVGRARPKKSNAISDLVGADISGLNLTPVVSKRVAIRQEIASKTATYRNRFLIDKKDFWLPLLPPHNYVRKLVEHHQQLSPAEIAKLPTVAPYQEIERQPRGIKATMKPYQLSGLSFMVYLHKNVRILPIHCVIEADHTRVCPAY